MWITRELELYEPAIALIINIMPITMSISQRKAKNHVQSAGLVIFCLRGLDSYSENPLNNVLNPHNLEATYRIPPPPKTISTPIRSSDVFIRANSCAPRHQKSNVKKYIIFYHTKLTPALGIKRNDYYFSY